MIIGVRGNYNYRGLPIENAFARIDTVQSYETHCTASVNIYASQEAFEKGESYLEQLYPVKFEKKIGDTVGDDRTQGYDFVKNLEFFQDWTIISA